MKKIRGIIVGMISTIYLILFFMRIDIPRNIFIVLTLIILTNKVIDEWNMYKETKKRIHLVIPISFPVIIIIVIYLLF